ncbi:indolepyruvate oxidoreductase subunit beta family protein [Frigidibacter sp. RF13]|uniref:indolepyruvate oxidoreductase subunit beta family protein n=1 Tax=Frigidibacter sp. RF13 TaxID=2997340 RepID=UPI00226F8408|nr:indolepyruvate oxidoreductase subunit beta family protein [Frigidibacter sp. RF13]MCY1126246.1 indolepyruvate oxidoreductase subunit beta family protein [Frigidibacter sp. RF13]
MARDEVTLQHGTPDPALSSVIKLAVMAVGGQGGGVLTGWIEDCARTAGYAVQATSVAGVAQRTGATIYYVEMAPAGARAPVFSLMPAAGDVDILIAAELMEAGRAILRGFVTPDRTTLIASTHRALSVSEKTVPGDGIAKAEEVLAAAEIAARRFIAFDMDRIAVEEGTVISASLLGALAASGTLPFSRAAFETAIGAAGRGAEASLKAFARAYEAATATPAPTSEPTVQHPSAAPHTPPALADRLASLPEPARDIATAGLGAVVDFQDLAYGRDYLDRLASIAARDSAENGFAFTREAAKYLAKAMAYDDVIRVADLKTRAARFTRIRAEMAPPEGAALHLTDFLHPRAEELVSLLPARLGARLEGSPRAMRLVDRLFNRGRRLRTDRLWPFLQLYLLAGLRPWRRGMLRHRREMAHLEDWLGEALAEIDRDYLLAVELVKNRRLIKGYSDTHARGLSKFDRVRDGARLVSGRPDAADWVRRLREAALQDETGKALDGALATIRSFAKPGS